MNLYPFLKVDPQYSNWPTVSTGTYEKTVRRLWRKAYETLQILHPDPLVKIVFDVQTFGYAPSARIYYRLRNLKDTSVPSFRIPQLDVHGFAERWPGLKVAQLWLTALWAHYMQHEALEQVSFKGQFLTTTGPAGNPLPLPVIDAHEASTEHQRLFNSNVEALLKPVLGHEKTRAVIDENRECADTEFAFELDLQAMIDRTIVDHDGEG